MPGASVNATSRSLFERPLLDRPTGGAKAPETVLQVPHDVVHSLAGGKRAAELDRPAAVLCDLFDFKTATEVDSFGGFGPDRIHRDAQQKTVGRSADFAKRDFREVAGQEAKFEAKKGWEVANPARDWAGGRRPALFLPLELVSAGGKERVVRSLLPGDGGGRQTQHREQVKPEAWR